MKKNIYALIVLTLLILSCGDPSVDIDNYGYEAKIVVEAFLFPGERIEHIRIMKNFEIGQEVDTLSLFLTPSENAVSASINGVALDFNSNEKTYYSDLLEIEFGETYELKISAQYNGQTLTAEASTTVPQKGFNITKDSLGTFYYGFGNPVPQVEFNTSPGSDFYVFSIIADSASLENFIYDNYFIPDLDTSDVEESFNSFKHQAKFVANIDSYSSQNFSFNIEIYDSWFYSSYRVIGYAGDENFRNFTFTAKNVKEFDGNFHEPILIFDDDGIGVFA